MRALQREGEWERGRKNESAWARSLHFRAHTHTAPLHRPVSVTALLALRRDVDADVNVDVDVGMNMDREIDMDIDIDIHIHMHKEYWYRYRYEYGYRCGYRFLHIIYTCINMYTYIYKEKLTLPSSGKPVPALLEPEVCIKEKNIWRKKWRGNVSAQRSGIWRSGTWRKRRDSQTTTTTAYYHLLLATYYLLLTTTPTPTTEAWNCWGGAARRPLQQCSIDYCSNGNRDIVFIRALVVVDR